MLITDQNPNNKSIMISVLGRPNAGKSTLINTLLGFDLSIVSHKPQTTRNNFHCALVIDETEIVLVDTPGIHLSSQELNIRMNGQAQFAKDGVDLNFILIDSTEDTDVEASKFKKALNADLTKAWVLFTKADVSKLSEEELEKRFEMVKKYYPNAERYFYLSAKTEDNIHLLTGAICDAAKPGPHLYPDGSVSNKNERFFVTEYVREQVFHILKDELPYETTVTIDEFHDLSRVREMKGTKICAKISATIHVNRQSQRAIVVGSKGSIIKKIGQQARKKVESMMGGQVLLNLHVKVSPRWFKNNYILEEIGLPRVQGSHRVWRAR